MKGVIRCVGNYADGAERFEIPISDPEGVQFASNQRIDYTLKVGGTFLRCGIRFTQRAGCWVSPDLYELNAPFRKVRLSEALLKGGFKKNEPVSLLVDQNRKAITVMKR